jgi:hypothetical protein
MWQVIKDVLVWPFQRRQRHIITLLVCLLVTGNLIYQCLREGVDGWVSCDFAGQWMHGRAFYREEADQLYLADAGQRWLKEGYSDKSLEEMIDQIIKKGHDGKLPDDNIEGPLYPPTAAMFFSLLAPFKPQIAHAIVVFVYLAMCYGCGWLISLITHGRIQLGEATLIILLFPNNFMGLILGQNQVLTLGIITLGWYCLSRRMPFVAGLIWSLLAYKPVFAVTLILVPILLPSLRMFLGMALGGFLFVALTLPFTGSIHQWLAWSRGELPGKALHQIEPWLRWLRVGQGGEELYRVDRNWVWMSRDLVGLPRRKMWDADSFPAQWRYNVGIWKPGACLTTVDASGNVLWSPGAWLFWCDDFDKEKHQLVYVEPGENGKWKPLWVPTLVGWCLLATVATGTILVGWITKRPPSDVDIADPTIGPRAVFLLTGALLCVLHFMHYDLVSYALPVLLFIDHVLTWRRWKLAAALVWLGLWACCAWSYYYSNGILRVPWETFLLLILWLWTCWLTWRGMEAS